MSKATFTLGELADKVTGGNLVAMAGLLNDVARGLGLDAQLDENEPNPGAQVAREAVINLAAYRAGDRVGRALAKLLVEETDLAGPAVCLGWLKLDRPGDLDAQALNCLDCAQPIGAGLPWLAVMAQDSGDLYLAGPWCDRCANSE